MKGIKKLTSIITSILLFACATLAPMSADAGVISDNTRAQIEASSESVYVTIDITYDNGMKAAIKKETNTRVAELSEKHFSEMDTSMYDEGTLSNLKTQYESQIRQEVYDEVYNKAVHESIDPYLEKIGVEPGKDVNYINYGRVECYLNEDQLEKAEKHSRTVLISVKEDYKNGVYIGNPDPYQIPGTTATFSATPSTTTTTVPTTQTTTIPTTTAETSTTEPVTTLEYTGAEMFTDTMKDIDDSTVTFSEHGQYRFLSADIREQFDSFVIGDEITIGFEFTKVNDTDTPRIDKIVMLSKTKPAIGDVNQDGKIDARDASDILKYYAENSVNTQIDQIKAQSMSYYGDLNDDGKTDAKDASDVLAIYAANSTQPSNDSKAVWNAVETHNNMTEISALYAPFEKEKLINDTDLVFNGTVLSINEFEVSGQNDDGTAWGPLNQTVINVSVNDVYFGNTDKKTIKLYYHTTLAYHYAGSFTIENGREYVFLVKDINDVFETKYNADKHADMMLTAGLRNGICPVSNDIVSVYYEYFDDNEAAKAKSLAKEEVMDKLTDDAKAANWFMYFNKGDFIELFTGLFNS